MHAFRVPLMVRQPLLWVLMFLAMGLGVLVSFVLDWQASEAHMQSVARERGAALFKLVELTRRWNARHGGVYVPVTEATPPNPYLKHPLRDVQTGDGRALTMINPAYMTRQIAEMEEANGGVRIHLTSNLPIRPANKPLDWEAAALHQFEAGLKESITFVEGAQPVHRYMAPLWVEEPCLKCHLVQGYKVGDLRGGISVTMPAQDLIALRDESRLRSALAHLLVFVLLSAMLAWLHRRMRLHVRDLEQVNQAQEATIAQRTASLAQANAALQQELAEREVAATVFEHAAEAILVLDAQRTILRVNPAFERLTGHSAAEVLGRGVESLQAVQDGNAPWVQAMRDGMAQEGRWGGEISSRTRLGAYFVGWLVITSVPGSNPRTFVATLSDISARKQEEERLRYLSQHDVLTGLANRALFADHLGLVLTQSQRHGRQFALLYIDIDHFKEVNDTLGHAVGDELLKEVSRRLLACVRQSDTVARMGGDEFAVIVTEFDQEQEVHQIAARIVTSMVQAFVSQGQQAQVSASIGVALYPAHGDMAGLLQERADAALYAVKQGGRNGFRFWQPEGL